MNEQKPVVLFDGVCNLCNGAVQFIIKRDPYARISFASLQSPIGQNLLEKNKLPSSDFDSFIFLEDGKVYTESTAALKTLRYLTGAWKLAAVLIIIPKPVRDFFYRYIAKNRYKWFGKKEQCMTPSEDTKKRFLQE
jgi:predicted DCC family thiol-disulfide oxidoreductase YuxK